MIIIPDLFTPYLEGVELARKANWEDLKNHNNVQKGQLDNLFGLATFSPKVNAEYEKTDKAALENLFNEENFQNKLLGEILNNQLRQAQIANTNRMAQGIGLRTSRGGSADGTAGTGTGSTTPGTAKPAPGLDPNMGKGAGGTATNAAATPLQQAQAELAKRGIGVATLTEYDVSRSNRGTPLAADYSLGENLIPQTVSATELSRLPAYGYRTPEQVSAWQQERSNLAQLNQQPKDDSLWGLGSTQFEGYGSERLAGLGVTPEILNQIQPGQGIYLRDNSVLYSDTSGNRFVVPYDKSSGKATFRVPL